MRDTKIALLGSADVFVAPHLARESFGIVLVEAMASGVPIVASELPSFVDLLGAPHDERATGRGICRRRPSSAGSRGAPGPCSARPAPGREGATGSARLRLVECRQQRPCCLSSGAFRRARAVRGKGSRMNTEEILGLVIILALILGWRITWLATRVDRANARAERTWAALDAALVRRAQRALELVVMPDIDPATALLVSDAAAAALEPDLSRRDRERAESDLSHVLDAVGSDASSQPEQAGVRASPSQHLSPIAQRRGGNRPVAAPPLHGTNLAIGGSCSRAASVRNGRMPRH